MSMTGGKREAIGHVAGTRTWENSPDFCEAEAESAGTTRAAYRRRNRRARLEAYEAAQAGRDPAASFYARLSQNYGTGIDLESVLREQRQAHRGIEL